jgi:iron complex transport system substrate-binding protein
MIRLSALVVGSLLFVLIGCGADDEPSASSPPDSGVEAGSTTNPITPTASSSTGDDGPGCVEEFDSDMDYFPDKVAADVSTGWSVDYERNYKVVRTGLADLTGGGEGRFDTYVLVQCGTPAPSLAGDLADATVIEVPVTTTVATYYEDITALYELGVAESIVAIPDAGFLAEAGKVLPTAVTDRVASGEVANFGDTVSAEFFVDLGPDVVFSYSVYGYDDHDLLRDVGVAVVSTLNAAEATPLGDAEWIEFFSLFYNAEVDGAAIFDEVSARYEELRELASSAATAPDAMFVSPYSAEYLEAHLNSWGARLIEDAGGTNLLADPDAPLSPQAVSLEAASEAGLSAAAWLTEFSAFDLSATRADIAGLPVDDFPSVADENVWNIGLTDPDRNLFYGVWSTRPDLLLADVISILHPDLLPDHTMSVLEPPLQR